MKGRRDQTVKIRPGVAACRTVTSMTTVPLSWVAPLDGWGEWMCAAHRSPATRKLRGYQLRRFAVEIGVDPWEVTTAQLVSWIAGNDWAAETKRAYRAGLRSFYSWGHIMGEISSDPAGLLPAIKTPTRKARPTPEALLDAVLAVGLSRRIRLMVLLAARLGLRRGEIAQVHTRDLERDILGWSLRVHGKGAKERVVPLCDEVRVLLQAAPAGYLFPGQIDGHLSAPYVGKLVSAVFELGWTTHTLRHRFATVCHDGSHDLAAVQALLGHSRPETTLGYIVVPTDSLRAAIAWAA